MYYIPNKGTTATTGATGTTEKARSSRQQFPLIIFTTDQHLYVTNKIFNAETQRRGDAERKQPFCVILCVAAPLRLCVKNLYVQKISTEIGGEVINRVLLRITDRTLKITPLRGIVLSLLLFPVL